MAVTLAGTATVEGVNGTATYAAIVSPGALEVISGRVSDKADVQRRVDANGEWRGGRVRNRRREFTITCLMKSASTQLRSDAVKAARLPVPYSKVVLAGFDDGAGDINGDYVYEEGADMSYDDDWTKITIPLVKPLHTTADAICNPVT